MMGSGAIRFAKTALIAAALLIGVGSLSPMAQPSGQFCSLVIPPTANTPLGNYSSLSGMLGLTLLIMLAMAMVAGVVYMIGRATGFKRLVNFSMQEVGEIAVTVIVVMLFVGTFTAATSFTPPAFAASAGAYNYNLFLNDCNSLSSPAIELFSYYVDLAIAQDVQSLVSSFSIKIMPYQFGVSFSPFAGLSTANAPIGTLLSALGAMSGFLVSISVLLGVFYAILPLFLFVGIILRTLPWTRAAGGSFLAMFMAFYIVFPILLSFMLGAAPLTGPGGIPQIDVGGIAGSLSNLGGSPGAAFALVSSILTVLDPLQLTQSLILIFAADFYVIFCIIFAFIISFDFMESVGRVLGAPSLASANTLKRLL